MSLENKLDKVLSEALPPRRAPAANLAKKQPAPQARPAQPAPAPQPTSPQKQKGGGDFAAVRKSMRKPMVNADAQIHNIDKMLNVTQKDPSQLGSTVQQMEKSFDSLLDPLKQVRSGVRQLKQAADQFDAEYVPGTGKDQEAAAPAPGGKTPSTVAPVQRKPEDDNEARYINKTVTDVEMVNNENDKLAAAKAGWDKYSKNRGKMNRGEFYRALAQKLNQAQQPQESSVQRRKLTEDWNKHYDLGQLQQGPSADDQLVNKVVTAIEIVNNLQDKKSAFRNGWVEYQSAGGKMGHSEFVRAVTNKLKMSLPPTT